MRTKMKVGILAGLFAGVLFGLLMELLPAPGPHGGQISMALFAALTVHAHSRLIGWLTYLVYGGILGGVFGYLLGDRSLDEAPAIVWGGVYGIVWWVVAGLILVPALLGSAPFSPAAMTLIRPIALVLLSGHLLYGVLLGAAFPVVDRRLADRTA